MSNLYQIMRQLKSDKSQSSSVGDTVQSPDKSGSDATPTINHRQQKGSEENVLMEKMSVPEISPEEDDTFEDEPDFRQEMPQSRVENNGGKLSSFLSRNVGTHSRDILVQGDSGSVVSELTFDHALRPLAHHQVLSTLAARRMQEEVASCESGESSFTPRTRGNATVSEETTSEMYNNSFQTSANEDALPPLHERAHDTDDASESGLHQPPVTPSPHSSFRNLYDARGNNGRGGMSSHSMESTDESLQYSEQDSALNDDQSFSVFSLSTHGYSVVSRSLRPSRVETVEEEPTQNDDSAGDFADVAAEAVAAHAAAQRTQFRRSSGTDESFDLSERDAIDFSERGATYVSSATESYVSTSYMSASTAGYSVRSAKPRWTSNFQYPSSSASVDSESNATNRASNMASEDSVDLASFENEPYLRVASEHTSNSETPSPAVTTTVEVNEQSTVTINAANLEMKSASPIPEVDIMEDEDMTEADEMSFSHETTLLIDLDSLTEPGELVKPNQPATPSATTGGCQAPQDLPAQANLQQTTTKASSQQPTAEDHLAESITADLLSDEDTASRVADANRADHVEAQPNLNPCLTSASGDCAPSVGESDAAMQSANEGGEDKNQIVEHHAVPMKADDQLCQRNGLIQVRELEWHPQELQETVSQESSTVDIERPAEKNDDQKKEKSGKLARTCFAWKWTWICIGVALVLAVLAVPAVVIPLVINHARKGDRRSLRGVSGKSTPVVLEVEGSHFEIVHAANRKVITRLSQPEDLLPVTLIPPN